MINRKFCNYGMLAFAVFGLQSIAAAVEATGADSAMGLQEVVVTARRVNENLQNVPIAVTAFSGAALQAANVVSIQDLNSKVPSLQTSNASGDRDQVIFSLRGLTETYGGSAPAVVSYFAEVPTFVPGPNILFDLDSLEVLKGPQGTLFGRNTTGGAILINPQRPTNDFGGYVDVSAGNYGLARVQAAVNIPVISDKLLVRFAIDSNHREGFTEDLQTGDKLDGIHYTDFRIGVTFKPIAGLENYFMYDQDKSNTHGGGITLSTLVPGSLVTEIAPGFASYFATQQANGVRKVDYSTGADFDYITTRALTDILTYAFSDTLSAKAIYGFREFSQRFTNDSDASPFPLIEEIPSHSGAPSSGVFGGPGSSKSQTGELQLQGKSFENKFPWTVGVYYENDKPYSTSQVDEVSEFYSNYLLTGLRYDTSKAAYAQGSYHLDELLQGLTFTGGVRYTKDARDLISSTVVNGACAQENSDANCQRTQNADFSATTYTVGLDYQVNPQTLVYIASRKGYKSGGFNASVANGSSSSFAPETVKDVELGIKADFHIGAAAARVNADYYRSKYSDIQLSHTFLTPDGSIITATGNVADATIQGVEMEATLIPAGGFELTAFYAYLDPTYDTLSYEGKPFYNTPRHKVGISAKYDIQIGAAGIVSPGVSYTYQASTHISNTPDVNNYDLQGGYGLMDAHLDWRGMFGSKVDVSAYVTNVTNKTYGVYLIDLQQALGFNSELWGAPRMFGVRAHYKF